MERTALTRASMKRKKSEVLVCQEKKLFGAMFVFKCSLCKCSAKWTILTAQPATAKRLHDLRRLYSYALLHMASNIMYTRITLAGIVHPKCH
ncbi:hypothetical protein HDV57DRAFT_432595 [Trichoderma longibrachiatum]|uniref:Uncharacterized protein n=1 Tax=Trichoderma longibrachiatum ATCC 18648 TaxID=983965 RepID=A0A2T4CFF9_TRILO|nr:hypothetical protein M440DRAFT_1121415 [Trichoderma longibrachiatum ATCC 18648]